jgi:rare lipoprotein A
VKGYVIILLFFFINCEKNENHHLKNIFVADGKSSWYGPGFQGKKTASGEKFDMNSLTAAHKQLEFGTFVRVKNVENRKEVIVRINDRGPFSKYRIIDLSKKAAGKIGLLKKGVAEVSLEIAGYDIVDQIAFIKHYKNIFRINQENNQ